MRTADALRGFYQQAIPVQVPERVIYPLEEVQVDKQHRDPAALALRLGQHLRQSVERQRSIR